VSLGVSARQSLTTKRTKGTKRSLLVPLVRLVVMFMDRIPDEIDAGARAVIDSSFAMHSTLGPGLLEKVYEVCLAHEIAKRGLVAARQVSLPVVYDNLRMDTGLRLDLLVGGCVIVEIKAVDSRVPIHTAQMLTYLRLSGLWLGLLINFNVRLIKDRIKRIAL
jgi:GxxExxY protein